jgi:capsular polysaccharide biosynthesis protein
VNPTLAQYGRVLRAHWRWLMWGILLALAATVAVLIVRPALYRSAATVFVRTPGDVSRVIDGGDSYAQARAETYAALARSTSVTSRVIADLGLNLTPEVLAQRIQATHEGGTALVDVAVNAPSAAEAQRTATVLLNELSTTVRSLESVPGSLVPRAELVVVDPPSQPQRIVAWGVPIALVLLGAALIGLVLGAVGAVLRSLKEQPLSDPDLEEDTPATELVPSSTDATQDVLVGSDGTIDAAPTAPGRGRHRAARQMLTNGNEGNA